MTEWIEYKLKDVADVTMGQSPKSEFYNTEEKGKPFLQGNRTFGRRFPTFDTWTTKTTKEAKAGDVIMSVRAPVGDLNITLVDMCLGRGVCGIRMKNGKQDFLYYLMEYSIPQLLNLESGTIFGSVNKNDINELRVLVPDEETQDKVTAFLKNIDDKIEMNEAVNRNLLEQAQVLYKSWFVDLEPFDGERPADWKDGIVNDLASEVICGKTPSTKKEEYYGDDIPFVTIPDMHGCVYTVHTEKSLSKLGAESQSKKMLPKDSICVSCIGTAGLVTLLSVPSQTNQQINSIIPKANYSPYYIYLLMSTMKETINKLGQAGSTIVNLNKTEFGKMEVLIPSIKVMGDFDEIAEPIFNTILSNQIENTKLSSLRDTLLPKLMSGELDVSDKNI